MSEETGLGEKVQDFIFTQFCNEVYTNPVREHVPNKHPGYRALKGMEDIKEAVSLSLLTIPKLVSVLFALTFSRIKSSE